MKRLVEWSSDGMEKEIHSRERDLRVKVVLVREQYFNEVDSLNFFFFFAISIVLELTFFAPVSFLVSRSLMISFRYEISLRWVSIQQFPLRKSEEKLFLPPRAPQQSNHFPRLFRLIIQFLRFTARLHNDFIFQFKSNHKPSEWKNRKNSFVKRRNNFQSAAIICIIFPSPDSHSLELKSWICKFSTFPSSREQLRRRSRERIRHFPGSLR